MMSSIQLARQVKKALLAYMLGRDAEEIAQFQLTYAIPLSSFVADRLGSREAPEIFAQCVYWVTVSTTTFGTYIKKPENRFFIRWF